jgi:hypothetical protein
MAFTVVEDRVTAIDALSDISRLTQVAAQFPQLA